SGYRRRRADASHEREPLPLLRLCGDRPGLLQGGCGDEGGCAMNLSRREALTALGAGILIAVTAEPVDAQRTNAGARAGTGERGDQRGRERPPAKLAARLHIGADGIVTVMSGKVECGQGVRAQLT